MQPEGQSQNQDAKDGLIASSSFEINSYLERAIPEIIVVAETVRRSSSVASVIKEIHQLSEGLEIINVFLNSLNAAGVKGDPDIPTLISNLSQSVTSMHDLIRDGDARSMGASIMNELLPTLTDIKKLSVTLSRSY